MQEEGGTSSPRLARRVYASLHAESGSCRTGGSAEDSSEFMAVLDAYAVLTGRQRRGLEMDESH